MSAFLSGYFIGLSLILAIGAQNAFVLRQGIKQQHVLLVCTVCALSDAVLIVAGVAGFDQAVTRFPWIEPVARYGGSAFLIIYGIKNFISAVKSTSYLDASGDSESSKYKVLLTCLMFTWLNPHVYLDTVIFLGSISTQYVDTKVQFTLGAIIASISFFFSLGYGAKLITPIFRSVTAWRVLDFAMGVLMFALAFIFLSNA